MATLTRPGRRGLIGFIQGIQRFDWWLFLVAAALIVVGLMSLYSIDFSTGTRFFRNQLLRLAIGLVPFTVFLCVKPESWRRFRWPLYGATLVMLLLVLVAGETKGGAQRWLQVGPIEVQPSELAKILLCITLSSYYSYRKREIERLPTFLIGFAHVAVPMALIYKQPHLGSTLVVGCMFLAISLVAGVPWRYLITLVVLGVGGLVAAFFIPGAMDDYQRDRVFGLFSPDQSKNGYHLQRSLIAFGSGGVGGEGFLKGEQKGGAFVPEQETDFVFTVLGEEGGLLGCFLALVAFGTLFGRLWWAMYRAQKPYHQMLLAGILAIFMAHTFANLGMILGILPVVGLWLPFMSFGGSALWLCMSGVALALRVKSTEDEGEMFEGASARNWTA